MFGSHRVMLARRTAPARRAILLRHLLSSITAIASQRHHPLNNNNNSSNSSSSILAATETSSARHHCSSSPSIFSSTPVRLSTTTTTLDDDAPPPSSSPANNVNNNANNNHDENDVVSFDFGDEEEVAPASSSSHSSPSATETAAKIVQQFEADDDTLSQNEFMTIPSEELIELIRNFLAERVTIVSVENKLFTALLSRSEELTTDQLLDVIEKNFSPKTNDRWGEKVKSLVRDRCFKEASGMKPLSVARAIVLLGINGRARRDVELFKKLCKILAHHINEIKDPHTLCYVLVGLQNSRIKPPDSFLALVGRRFPILNKKNPLFALPAYRALTFYSRAEYPLMNPYRYLADRIMAIVRDRLRAEGKGQQFEGLGRKVEGASTSSSLVRDADGDEVEGYDDVGSLSNEDLDILKGLQREDKRRQPSISDEGGAAASTMVSGGDDAEEETATAKSGGGGWGASSITKSRQDQQHSSSGMSNGDGGDGENVVDREAAGSSSNNAVSSGTTTDELDDISDLPPLQDDEENQRIETQLRSAGAIPNILKASVGSNADPDAAAAAPAGKQQQQDENPDEREDFTRPPMNPNSHEFLTAQFVKRTGGLSPTQFVRFLFILALRRAPRQQYLRPVATDLLVPVVPILSPPTFMKLVQCVRMFHSEDKALISAILERIHSESADRVCLRNLFELLRLFGNQQIPIEFAAPHLPRFVQLCKLAFEDESQLRARDMLAITGELRNIHAKLTATQNDDWLNAVAPDDDDEAAAAAELGETLMSEEKKKNNEMVLAIEEMFSIVERFALRMTNLMSLGVLALSNAETLLEICKALPVSESTASALTTLKDCRRRIDEEEGGPDAYADILDIDVREIFFRLQSINNYDTFRSFRPLPATLIQDFKGLLDNMRADYILEAVHVYEQAFPGTLAIPVKRVLSRHILEKMRMELDVMAGGAPPPEPEASPLTAAGKIIEVEKAKAAAASAALKDADDNFRPFGAAAGKFSVRFVDDAMAAGVPKKFYAPYDCMAPRYQTMLFNSKKFAKFTNMLSATPLKRVRNSPLTWLYVEKKAEKLKLSEDAHISKVLQERRVEIRKMLLKHSERQIHGEVEVHEKSEAEQGV